VLFRSGPAPGTAPLIDAGAPAKTKLSYRLRFQAGDGLLGEPSDAADVTTP